MEAREPIVSTQHCGLSGLGLILAPLLSCVNLNSKWCKYLYCNIKYCNEYEYIYCPLIFSVVV